MVSILDCWIWFIRVLQIRWISYSRLVLDGSLTDIGPGLKKICRLARSLKIVIHTSFCFFFYRILNLCLVLKCIITPNYAHCVVIDINNFLKLSLAWQRVQVLESYNPTNPLDSTGYLEHWIKPLVNCVLMAEAVQPLTDAAKQFLAVRYRDISK